MQTWLRRPAAQTEHRNVEERWFYVTLNMLWLLVPDRLAWAFQKLLIFWDFPTQLSLKFAENDLKKRKYPVSSSYSGGKCLVDTGGQRSTHYHKVCRRTSLNTWRVKSWNRSSSRRPHRVLLLSAKNRKLRVPFEWAHQSWTIEDHKSFVWSAKAQFLLWNRDGTVRIRCKQHVNVDPSCLVWTAHAGGDDIMVWGIFS